MGATTTALISAAGVIGAAVIGFFVSARRFSGTIRSSEAATLWAQAEALRGEYQARGDALEKENERLRGQVRELQDHRIADLQRIAALEAKLRLLSGEDEPPGYLS